MPVGRTLAACAGALWSRVGLHAHPIAKSFDISQTFRRGIVGLMQLLAPLGKIEVGDAMSRKILSSLALSVGLAFVVWLIVATNAPISTLVIFRFGATMELGRSERTTMRPLLRPL